MGLRRPQHAAADFFVFDAIAGAGAGNVDTITDFAVVDDTVQLEKASFTDLGLATGALSSHEAPS